MSFSMSFPPFSDSWILALFLKIAIELILPTEHFMNIGILILSFQLLEFWFFYKHYNSDLILQNVGIFGVSF